MIHTKRRLRKPVNTRVQGAVRREWWFHFQGLQSLPHPAHALKKLDEKQREASLRKLEINAAGKAWLRETLRYIMEALLIDPVYGSNPNAVGWKWLKHRPGFPRPLKDKRYFLL